MKRLFLILLALALLVPSACAFIEYDGYAGYDVDGFVIFVPDSWDGGSSDGKTIFFSETSDRALVASVRHLTPDNELTAEENAGLVYGAYFRSLSLDGLRRDPININGDPAEIWIHVDVAGDITAGLVYLHGSDFLALYYQIFEGEQDPELTELRAICEKISPFDIYYQE